MLRVAQRVATFCNTPGNGLAIFCKAAFFCAMERQAGVFHRTSEEFGCVAGA